MTPVYDLNSPPSPFPFIELKEDQLVQFFIPPDDQASSSLSSPIFLHQDEIASHHSQVQQNDHHKAVKYILQGGSSDDHQAIASCSSVEPMTNRSEYGGELSTRELKDEKRRENEPTKWMPLKMRVMRKMMDKGCDKQETDMHKFHDQHGDNSETSCPNYNSTSNIIRACSDCNTTKTPLWRSGPQGPKTLCNACGIRQRKARRAMAAAAATANGVVIATENSKAKTYKVQNKEKKSRSSYMAKYKKPFKLPPCSSQCGEKVSFEDFAMSLSKNLTIREAFPKDEEEAAILLMALSCGRLHS